MSSSLSAAPAITTSSGSSSSTNTSILGGTGGFNRNTTTSGGGVILPPNAAQFREIHKNTWLKRLSADGKKITVGPKKSERSWVVFCVHDDTEALLEGYAEPRQAAAHLPEWIVSLQDTLHISHALIPNSHEFEFVVTLSNEVLRFHAMSWEIMQEWVETLRLKLREMKILSPRENLYTKLPEVRAPLLPTRDPTSPLPAPPPVPAAIVPGVERVIPQQQLQQQQRGEGTENARTITTTITTTTTTTAASVLTANVVPMPITATNASVTATVTTTITPNLTSMSNTLTQNLLNMLSDPISTYSEQINDTAPTADNDDDDNDVDFDDDVNDDGDKKDVTVVDNNEPHSTNTEQDLNLSDDEFLSPMLRKACVLTENGVRVDITPIQRASADQLMSLEHLLQCERLIPRPQTSRSQSAGAADKTKRPQRKQTTTTQATTTTTPQTPKLHDTPTTSSSTKNDAANNITIIQVSTTATTQSNANTSKHNAFEELPPKLPTKTINAEIFRFPEISVAKTKMQPAATSAALKQLEYKSNVQIIPSNTTNTSTIQVLGSHKVNANQYSSPVKSTAAQAPLPPPPALVNTTMVRVIGDELATPTTTTTSSVAIYGTCYTPTTTAHNDTTVTASPAPRQVTPKLTKKIILSANTSGITNITVNNEACCKLLQSKADDAAATTSSSSDVKHNVGNVYYEKVFLSSSIPITAVNATTPTPIQQQTPSRRPAESRSTSVKVNAKKLTNNQNPSKIVQLNRQAITDNNCDSSSNCSSPALPRRRAVSPQATSTPQQLTRPLLTRGLTEAVINTRPSRRDFHYIKLMNTPNKSKTNNPQSSSSGKPVTTNNNIVDISGSGGVGGGPTTSASATATPVHQGSSAAMNRANTAIVIESMEQRRRSSSTSDAQAPLQRTSTPASTPPQRGTNNNELPLNGRSGALLRIQQPPLPFRNAAHNEHSSAGGNSCSNPSAAVAGAKRLTLREQQVMQLRREIMHPGGVRLQLRRKDCVGSIAWVDAFGAVWVAGWKQKEHPVLYNALHIGDQLLSIAGVSISNAAEANKIIRNANTLFVEVLVRRIPFGRAYAIRREREGQCLGLIRDGNTSTIVDVVPNSLAARHGLPPKAQSCDGSTLTFWMLTEINGRPLNLYFKDNEIRDRLNSVGRDISILVQPSDLITKLKKQLKSLRGYKDYLVQ